MNSCGRASNIQAPRLSGQGSRRAWCALLAGSLVLGLAGCRRPGEQSTPTAAKLPPPNIGGEGMNVLLISVDTTRADHFGCYGHREIKTPSIDRFAEEGTRFAMCVSSAPLTLPSHSTMLTGSYPYLHGARDNGIFQLDEGNLTLAEAFSQADYATHGEVAAMVLDGKFGMSQGFDTFGDVEAVRPPERRIFQVRPHPQGAQEGAPDLRAPPQPVIKPERPEIQVERKADEITIRGIELLTEKAKEDEPFFMFLHYFDPHWPHEAPERFTEQYRDGYYAEIAFFDEQFGMLMDALRALGLSEKTLVILTSDHGEGRGQHGEITHSTFLYDTTLHVPLIMWCPGQVPAGRVVESQVRLIDLASTIMGFARLNPVVQMQGASLLPFLADASSERDLVCYSDTMVPWNMYGFSPLRSLRAEGWKYILAPHPELYHVAEDPLELINLAELEPQRSAAMREQIRDIIANSPPPPGSRAKSYQVGSQDIAELAALGYLSFGSAERDLTVGSELDHFEPFGENPKDHIEQIEAVAMGLGAIRAGYLEEAEKLLRRLLDIDPNYPLAPSYLSAALIALERYDEAIDMLRRSLELRPDRFIDVTALAMLLAYRGEYEEAEKYYRRAAELVPESFEPLFNLGKIYILQGRYEDASEVLGKAVELAPRNAAVRFQEGVAHLWAGRPAVAAPAFEQALLLNPDMVDAQTQLAFTLCRLNQAELAIERLTQAIERMPEAGLLHQALGECYIGMGNLEGASDSLRKAVELEPDDADRQLALALCLIARQEYAEAIEHLRKSLELRPDFPATLFHLARALENTGETDEAVATYRQLLKVQPGMAVAYRPAANLLIAMGDLRGGLRVLVQGQEIHPADPQITNDLAWWLATAGDAAIRDGPRAVELAQLANNLTHGQSPHVLDTLAAAYAEAERFDQAIATARLALELAEQTDAEELAAGIRSRLSLYEAHQPYRGGE